jgi:hypothetical protein
VTATASAPRQAVLVFLADHGAATTPHLFGDLLSHLVGTERLVRRWGGSGQLALAALAHASYGTDGFAAHLVPVTERAALADVIGAEAEALVYFYASCDRGAFYPQIEEAEVTADELVFRDRFAGRSFTPATNLVTAFVDLTYANEGELAASSPDGAAEAVWLAEFHGRTRQWASPGFARGLEELLTGGR